MLGCWNPKKASLAVLVCISASLWVLVANATHSHKVECMSPTRIKRDFGISTAVTTAILVAVAGGAVATACLIQTGAMANALTNSHRTKN